MENTPPLSLDLALALLLLLLLLLLLRSDQANLGLDCLADNAGAAGTVGTELPDRLDVRKAIVA